MDLTTICLDYASYVASTSTPLPDRDVADTKGFLCLAVGTQPGSVKVQVGNCGKDGDDISTVEKGTMYKKLKEMTEKAKGWVLAWNRVRKIATPLNIEEAGTRDNKGEILGGQFFDKAKMTALTAAVWPLPMPMPQQDDAVQAHLLSAQLPRGGGAGGGLVKRKRKTIRKKKNKTRKHKKPARKTKKR